MAEWKKYEGTDEQIAEMRNSEHGWIAKFKDGSVSGICGGDRLFILDKYGCTYYLICNPHPLVDMIARQAKTGQPVWMEVPKDAWGFTGTLLNETDTHQFYITNKPNWNIPNANYSFTPFEE